MSKNALFSQVGLGLRRDMLPGILDDFPPHIGFMEVAPENWMNLGGQFKTQFEALNDKVPFYCHGLSLSLGSPDPLDIPFIKQLKQFFDRYDIHTYSEHLSYCSADGHLYDLMPIPFTLDAATYVAERIRIVQDILERPIAIENVSYYCAPGQEMTELAFTNEVLSQADCQLLLDVNNIYVNSVNHRYDAHEFLAGLPSERVAYMHIAGHYNEADDLIVDTHGSDVIAPVWDLLDSAYALHGVKPTLLERDFNIPPMHTLINELKQIQQAQHKASQGNVVI